MSESLVKINCEYDIDQEYYVFRNDDAAIKFVDESSLDESYDELEEAGLVNLESIEVIG
jgi:hypothetical protein